MNSSLPPSGWYPDPAGSGDERFWDGQNWSQATRPKTEAPPAPMEPGVPPAHPQTYAHPQTPGQPRQAPQVPGYQPYGYQPAPAMSIAGWWWRVLAYLLDGLLLYFPVALLQQPFTAPMMAALEAWANSYIYGGNMPFPQEIFVSALWASLIGVVVWIAYRTVMVGWKGGTLGQLILGMRVVRDGDQSLAIPSWKTATTRAAVAIVLINLPIVGLVNLLWPLFNDKRQALHDLVAKTVVLKKN